MKIIVCDPIDAESIDQMHQAGLEVDVRDSITSQELAQVLPAYDGMVVRSRTKVPAALIDAAPNLKVIVRGGVGLDTINVEYARARGITVMNTPAASSAAVAELTIGYMFAMARHLYETTASMKAGKWEKKKFKDLPLNGQTRNMIGHTEFDEMKAGVRVINCARGGIIDEDALYEALVSGKVAGAALDVYAVEPPQGSKLFTLDQVIGSPHIGAATSEAQGRIGSELAEKLIAFGRENQ
ncbi:MAG: NAD(P)-dependent oxidoreductase [Anaerolineales bacterium]